MKRLAFLFVLAIIFSGCLQEPVSKAQFRKAHKYLNQRVDTLSRNQKIMIRNQKVIYTNQQKIMDSVRQLQEQLSFMSQQLDSLQSQVHNLEVGQYVIYDAITSPQQPTRQSKDKFLNLRKFFQWRKQK